MAKGDKTSKGPKVLKDKTSKDETSKGDKIYEIKKVYNHNFQKDF